MLEVIEQKVFKSKMEILESKIRYKYFKGDEKKSFADMIYELKNKEPIRRYYLLINIARQIRNTIEHNHSENLDPILSVSDEIYNTIEKLIDLIDNPPKALDSDIIVKNIFAQNIDDNINEAVKVMADKIYTHIPIYNGNELVGIFSENVFFNIMLKDKEILLDKNSTFRDIKDYLDISKHTGEKFIFINSDVTITQVQEYFENYFNNMERLAVVYITQNGNKYEKILGMITPWDILGKDDKYE